MDIEKDIQRRANIYARSRGFGKATEVRFQTIRNPRIIKARSYRYKTRGGIEIYYPSAYSKKGWSNMVYCHAYCIVAMPHPQAGEH